jgi:hypothetical protein
MTDSKTLIQRIAMAISTAPQGETYADYRNNEAKAALEEIADWMEENSMIFVIASKLRDEANK